MNVLSPLDAAMMTAELLSSPMHVGVVLILSPPPGAGPDYLMGIDQRAVDGDFPFAGAG